MPWYEYRCAAGHVTEQRQPRDIGEIDCAVCSLTAQRLIPSSVGFSGFAQRPTREAPIPLSRAIEAQHEIIYQSNRAGIQPPDLMKAARQRIARGDVKAIE